MDDCGGASAAKRRSCMAVGCEILLSDLPKYCVQRRLCPEHLKAISLQRKDYGDQLWRFCQQCGKLEPLSAFDGTKRSCRAQLAKRRANTCNRGGPSSSAEAPGVAASLKPLSGGIRKVSSQGSGLDKLALLSHAQAQEQLQLQQLHPLQPLPQLQQHQLLPQQLQCSVQQRMLQHGLLLQQQQAQQQQHAQQQAQQQHQQQQQVQQQELELDVSLRLHKVKQQLASLESQLAILQEQQQVEAQLAALQQQYDQMQQLQQAHSQVLTAPLGGSWLQPFSQPLYRMGTDISSASNNLLLQGSNTPLQPAVAAAVQSAPIPTISAPAAAAEVSFIPFMRGGQGWGAPAPPAAAAVAAPVTAGMSAGLPPVASSGSRQRSISSLLPFPGREYPAAVPKAAGGSSSMGNSSISQPLHQMAGNNQFTVHTPAAAVDACAARQAGQPQLLGMHGAIPSNAHQHMTYSAPVLHIDELLPAGDIPDLEEFLAAGGTFEPLDSGSTHNILSGDAISSTSRGAAAAGPTTSAGANAGFSGWGFGGQEAASAAAQYCGLPPMGPSSWAGPSAAAAAGGPAAVPAQGCGAVGGNKGRSSLDMFAGLLEDVLAEIQAEATAAGRGAGAMHV